MKKNELKNQSFVMTVFDTLFIMILCFATLLSSMIMKGDLVGLVDYSINWQTFSLTLLLLVVYIVFVVIQSEKGLRDVISSIYGDKNVENNNADVIIDVEESVS